MAHQKRDRCSSENAEQGETRLARRRATDRSRQRFAGVNVRRYLLTVHSTGVAGQQTVNNASISLPFSYEKAPLFVQRFQKREDRVQQIIFIALSDYHTVR